MSRCPAKPFVFVCWATNYAHLGMCVGALPSRRNHVAIVVHRLLRGLSGHPFRRLSADDFLSWRSVEKDDINGDGEVFDNLQSKLEH